MAELCDGFAAVVEKAQQQYRKDRTDGAQGDQAEAIRLGAVIAADIGHAHAHGQDEGDCHRARRHAAGVKGDAEKIRIREGGQEKDQRVAAQQQPAEIRAGDNPVHAQGHEQPDADADGDE